MKYFYEIFDNGMVQLVINLDEKSHAVTMRNHNEFHIYDQLKFSINEIMDEDEDDPLCTSHVLDLTITDPDYNKAVEHTVAYEMQNKDQCHVLFVPLDWFDKPHTTVCKEIT